jgi:fanconi-associated nuclease 1
MLAEDYAGTGSGVPDLFLWRTEDMTAKFVEVKSPSDTLSEKQKVRFHYCSHSLPNGS